MADLAEAEGFQAPDPDKPTEYDAFLSYAHRDKEVTTATQKGLHQIGRRVGQLRALRVFRDDTNLTASPDLWGKITEALDRSRFMIVVLSPQSAGSHWVNEEVRYWLEHCRREHLMLVLAEGHLHWDAANARFDPELSNAAPPMLTQPGSLRAEPLYIDVSGDAPWDLRSLVFRDKVTALAAPIHGKPKDQLAGDDIREQRRFRRVRRVAIAGLAMLTVVAVVAAGIAVAQRQEALRRFHEAIVAKLNAEGAAILAGDRPGEDTRALQELLAAHAIADRPEGAPILDAQIARFTTQKIINTGSFLHALAYSPDGRRLVTGQQGDGILRQWDPATGKSIGAPMKGSGLVTGVAFTPDGQTMVSTYNDGTMRLWNTNTGAALNPNPQHVAPLSSVAVSGKAIVTGSFNGAIQAWDSGSGRLMATRQIFAGRKAAIEDVTFDRSGHLFAVSGFNGSIIVYDTDRFEPHAPTIVVQNLYSKPTAVWRIAFSPDGHTIAAGAGTLQLWNADTGTLIRTIRAGTSKEASVDAVAFSPDGHRIATGRSDGALQLWDTGTGAQLGQTLLGHTAMVMGVKFSPDGRQIATVSADGTLRLWSATIGQAMNDPDPVVFQEAFSPDNQRVAASGDTTVQQWDIHSGQPFSPLTSADTGARWFGYADGGRIVTAVTDGTVQVWDTNTGQPAGPPVRIAGGNPGNVAFTPDRHMLASGDDTNGTVRLWDVATGQPIGQPMTVDPANPAQGLAFSPDGHRLIAGYFDGSLRLWNVDATQLDGTAMTNPAITRPVGTVAFSPDGITVAAGYSNGDVELWDSHTRKQLPGSPLHGHTDSVLSLAFGVAHQLASGGTDGTLRLWDTATGNPTSSPITRSDAVASVAISPDGRLVASGSMDGTVLLSPAIADPSQLCDKLSTNMSHKQWRAWVSPGIDYITVCPGLPIAPD